MPGRRLAALLPMLCELATAPLHPSQIPPKYQWYLFNDFAITPVDEVCTVQVLLLLPYPVLPPPSPIWQFSLCLWSG